MCFIRLLNLEYNFLFAVDTRIYEQFFRICERRVCPVKSALSSYTWRSIEGGCGASALHMSRMSQHASVIAKWHVRPERRNSRMRVGRGKTGRATRTRSWSIVTWIKDQACISWATFHRAPILTVILTFSISSLEPPFAIINPLSAFSIVFRSSYSRKYDVDEYTRLK